ncbi:MAG: hypothetical protein R2788_18020 [Saprospiraceae bacterium]
MHAITGLYYFNSTNEQFTYVGDWPIGFPNGVYLYEQSGNIYAISINPPSEIWQIDLNDPANSVFIQNIAFPNTVSGAVMVNNEVFVTDEFWIYSYDPVTNTSQQVCNALQWV